MGARAIGMALLVLPSAGCATDLARASSGAIGCPAAAIEVSNISVGWSRMSWRATCRGLVFYCSGEANASCAPGLEVSPAAPRPGPATPPARVSSTPPTQDENE